jgi:methylated-DNA-[protein]-cysteine S-methyltransferase
MVDSAILHVEVAGKGLRPSSRAETTPPSPVRVLVPSPIGILGLEFRGRRVSRMVIGPDRKLKKTFLSLAEVSGMDYLDEAVGRLSEYFAGARRNPLIEVDLSDAGLDELSLRVLQEVAKIPYGETRTYRKLAAGAGRSSAYRAVRAILMENPVPILIPCHRVLPQKAGVGTWVGGQRKKEWLIKLEQRVSAAEQESR